MIWTLLQEDVHGTQEIQTGYRGLIFILVFFLLIAAVVIWWIKRST
jgi:hypothetical protein